MTASRLVGLVIAAIGFLSGFALVVQPFYTELQTATLVLVILFPVCILFGIPLYAVGEERAMALRLSSFPLILIGLAALLGIFVDATGIIRASQTTALWVIFPASLSLGLLLNYFAVALDGLVRQNRNI